MLQSTTRKAQILTEGIEPETSTLAVWHRLLLSDWRSKLCLSSPGVKAGTRTGRNENRQERELSGLAGNVPAPDSIEMFPFDMNMIGACAVDPVVRPG
jgi:hypothetical protein